MGRSFQIRETFSADSMFSVTNGLYVNISLHDYLRGLTNTHHSASDWTLDPRVEVGRLFDPEGVPRGIGNQVSAEFNLLYRFHSVISRRDEKWMNEFLQELFPGNTKPLDQLTPMEFIQGLLRFEQNIPDDPGKRTFAKLERDTSGKFNDAELVNLMKESMEDPAGLFNARMVPKALRIIEVTGILTARKWNLASLNEMRDFFGLKRHDTFEDINPDPYVADLLRKLYDHPDMVEMYPGLFLEDGKPRMDPGKQIPCFFGRQRLLTCLLGCGGCPPYTVGRAVFSDAVTLVRSDRFLTLVSLYSTGITKAVCAKREKNRIIRPRTSHPGDTMKSSRTMTCKYDDPLRIRQLLTLPSPKALEDRCFTSFSSVHFLAGSLTTHCTPHSQCSRAR